MGMFTIRDGRRVAVHVIVVGVVDRGVRAAHGGDVAVLVVLQRCGQVMRIVIPIPECRVVPFVVHYAPITNMLQLDFILKTTVQIYGTIILSIRNAFIILFNHY